MTTKANKYELDIENLRIANKAIALLIIDLETQGISSNTLELALSLAMIEYTDKHHNKAHLKE